MPRSRSNRIAYSLAAAALLVGGSGCASKGFVRQQMSSLESKMTPATQQAQADARSAQALAQTGDEHARAAQREASMARDLALGNVKREEVRRVTVNFAFDSADIPADARLALDGVTADLLANVNYMALLTGYTDATGDEQYNVGLAQRRAAAVQLYLAQRLGSDFVRLATIGFGAVQPVASNDTAEGRARNRRTEVIVVRPTPANGAAPGLEPTALRH
jgi:outer membrane protein OmpA-like peptidoglycan-associated protein